VCLETTNKVINRILEELDERYAERRNKETEELYNAIAEVCIEQKATRQNMVFVAELIKFIALRSKFEEISGNVKIPEGSVPLKKVKLSDRPPTPMQ
jgi:hypothetical protein